MVLGVGGVGVVCGCWGSRGVGCGVGVDWEDGGGGCGRVEVVVCLVDGVVWVALFGGDGVDGVEGFGVGDLLDGVEVGRDRGWVGGCWVVCCGRYLQVIPYSLAVG